LAIIDTYNDSVMTCLVAWAAICARRLHDPTRRRSEPELAAGSDSLSMAPSISVKHQEKEQ